MSDSPTDEVDNGLDMMPPGLAAVFPRLYAQEKAADPIRERVGLL